MRIEKILGSIVIDDMDHSVARLENGRYAVGSLMIGKRVAREVQFETVVDAFEHWLATLPITEVFRADASSFDR